MAANLLIVDSQGITIVSGFDFMEGQSVNRIYYRGGQRHLFPNLYPLGAPIGC